MTTLTSLRRALGPVLLSAALTATALQVTGLATPGHALAAHPHSLSALLGNWVNVDPATRSIVRIDIADTGSGLTAHNYGACSPTPCDWGTVPVMGANPPGYTTYTFSFAVKKQIITPAGSLLRVITYTHFTDQSGRKDYRSFDYFRNASQQRPGTVMWINHLSLLAGDPSVSTAFNAVSSGVGGGLSGLIISSSTTGDTAAGGGNKVVETGTQVPPGYTIMGVRVCYESSSAASYIDQIRLAQVQDPPGSAAVLLDDATHLTNPGPVCVDSAATSVDPSQGEVLLSLRVNFGSTSDRIVVRALGLLLARS